MKACVLIRILFAGVLCLALSGCGGNAPNGLKTDESKDAAASSAQPAASAPFYNTPEGGVNVVRYGEYIYYLPGNMGPDGAVLCRMREDGTCTETLPEVNASEFLTAGGEVYMTGIAAAGREAGGSDCILRRIEPDGTVTEIMRYHYGMLRVLDGGIYCAPYDPMNMELAEEQERKWTDVSGSGEVFSAKGTGDNVYMADG